ncbi:MAG: DeoR/GlpR family DNA-binding transcription regulator [Pseudomonadota bacterium]
MNALTPRQLEILDIARSKGHVNVELLSSEFAVTPQTIRKDLNDLCNFGELNRVHGGAVFPSNTVNVAYKARREIGADSKRRIGETVASMIPDNASVILNIGTTTEQVALALRNHKGLMVITNNLNVAQILSEAPDVELFVAGGLVRKSDGGIIGAAATDLIRQFKVDYAIIGTSAIDEEGSLLDFDYREVRVTHAIIEQARTTILVADSSKFERRAPVEISRLTELDVFVTDEAPPEQIVSKCKDAEVEIVVADGTHLMQVA